MAILEKIPCTIVTGFLGAGKTTLVRHTIEQARGRRLAVIVNEFGDLGFDGSFLAACGVEGCTEDSVVELPNGCICCTVADDFVPALTKLLDRPEPPEHILIETSGLALPKPLVQAFQWPAIRSRVTVDGVVAVVDGPAVASGLFAEDPDALANQRAADQAVDHDNPLEEVFEDQILCADLVVLNKSDLLDEAARDKVRAEIEAHLPRAVEIVATEHGRLDPRVLLGISAAAEDDLDARPSHHGEGEDHDHDDFESVALPIGVAGSPRRPRRPRREGRRDRGRAAHQGLRRGEGQADASRGAGGRPPRRPPLRPSLEGQRAPRRPPRRHRSQGFRQGRGRRRAAGMIFFAGRQPHRQAGP